MNEQESRAGSADSEPTREQITECAKSFVHARDPAADIANVRSKLSQESPAVEESQADVLTRLLMTADATVSPEGIDRPYLLDKLSVIGRGHPELTNEERQTIDEAIEALGFRCGSDAIEAARRLLDRPLGYPRAAEDAQTLARAALSSIETGAPDEPIAASLVEEIEYWLAEPTDREWKRDIPVKDRTERLQVLLRDLRSFVVSHADAVPEAGAEAGRPQPISEPAAKAKRLTEDDVARLADSTLHELWREFVDPGDLRALIEAAERDGGDNSGPPYTLDGMDPVLRDLIVCAVHGAMATTKPPPAGHWLQSSWELGRALAHPISEQDSARVLTLLDVAGFIEPGKLEEARAIIAALASSERPPEPSAHQAEMSSPTSGVEMSDTGGASVASRGEQ